jgi:hypothetical protein
LISPRVLDSGVVILSYQVPDGEVPDGDPAR